MPRRHYSILIFSIILMFGMILHASKAHDAEEKVRATLTVSPTDCGLDPWTFAIDPKVDMLPELKSIRRRQDFVIYISADNYSMNESHNVDLIYDLSIYRPDGSLYYEEKSVILFKGNVIDSRPTLLSNNNPNFSMRTKDPIGEYNISLSVTDQVSGHKDSLSRTITVAPTQIQAVFNSKEGYGTWLNNYYKNPSPDTAITAYLYIAPLNFSPENALQESALYTQSTFYQTVIKNNPWTLPYIAALYARASTEIKQRIIFMLTIADYPEKSFFAQLEGSFKTFHEWAKQFKMIPTEGKVKASIQVDVLWAKFIATGKIDPIRSIIGTLQLVNYETIIEDKPKNLNKAQEEQRMHNDNLFRLTKWSIVSNCREDALVKQYCEYIYNEKKLNHAIMGELYSILSQIDPKHYPPPAK